VICHSQRCSPLRQRQHDSTQQDIRISHEPNLPSHLKSHFAARISVVPVRPPARRAPVRQIRRLRHVHRLRLALACITTLGLPDRGPALSANGQGFESHPSDHFTYPTLSIHALHVDNRRRPPGSPFSPRDFRSVPTSCRHRHRRPSRPYSQHVSRRYTVKGIADFGSRERKCHGRGCACRPKTRTRLVAL
jgi:hypothetical protein